MRVLTTALLVALASPALAQTRAPAGPEALKDCPPIGQTARGEMVYGMDCKALKAETKSPEFKPDMATTNMKDTVIPKSGGVQQPPSEPPKGENR